METRIAPLSQTAIAEAAQLLLQGEPVVFPTETVYGLGATIFNPNAIVKIFSIKKRPQDNPLIVHVASIEEAMEVSFAQPAAFLRLAERFWPGPLSIVLKRSVKVPALISAGHSTLAIRMPSHSAALELIRLAGPLAAPSANLSGRPSPTCALDVFEDLQGRVALILDGGACQIGIESTVLDLSQNQPFLLRPGAISKDAIEAVLQEKIALPAKNSPVFSPGMKYRHYAPKAKVRLIFKREDLSSSFILSPHPTSGERLLSVQTLYAQFREADRLGVASIDVECSPAIAADMALMNRLLKASCDIGSMDE